MDQIKTQVLFLHSEPSAMEPAASRLPDNFSVHMASSGTEALTTLGLTPIHIIVSAEDLPGMSGREALAEASKRSPDTRGILLASPRMTSADRAALVSASHLHQVLSARSTPNQICDAVLEVAGMKDSDTLPQPANDHSAGPAPARTPEAARQTSQFATTSGLSPEQIPTLQPGSSPFQPTMDTISKVEVLVLTNDGSFLNTIRAAVGNSHMVNHAPNLQEAVDVVKLGRSGILITDAAVATKDVEIITSKLRKHLPSLVTIVAGRREDGEKMMGLISDGLVYRFLLKPISAGRSRLAIEASAKKHLALANTEVPLSAEEVQKKMTETGVFNAGSFQSGAYTATDIRATRAPVEPLDPLEGDDEPSAVSRILGLLGRIPPRYLLGAAAAVGAIAVVAALFSGSADPGPESRAPAAAAETPAAPSSAKPAAVARPAPTQSESSRLVAAAERAMQQNRLIDPPGENAVEFYAGALAASPDSRSIRRALDVAVERSLSVVENDLLRGDTDAVERHLATLNRIAPDHPRLPFLNRQAEQKVQAALLARARELAADGDAAGAGAVLDEAAERPGADADAIAAVRAEIGTAGDELLSIPALIDLAADRVTRGELVEPFNDSARYYYQAVLARDPDNAIAAQGLTFLSGLLLGNSRNALARGDTDSAYRWLLEAEATGASPEVVAELRSLIAAEQAARERAGSAIEPTAGSRTEGVPVAEGDAASESPAVEPPVGDGENAALETATDPAVAAAAEAAQPDSASADATDDTSRAADAVNDTVVASEVAGAAAGADSAAGQAAEGEGDAVQVDESAVAAAQDGAAAEANAPPAGAAVAATDTVEAPADTAAEPELEQLRYVPPRYPRSAQRREVEGWVDVEFVVQANGRTAEVNVLDSAPPETFDRAAIDAVEAWRYAPLSQTDSTVSRRARVRLEFTLQD